MDRPDLVRMKIANFSAIVLRGTGTPPIKYGHSDLVSEGVL